MKDFKVSVRKLTDLKLLQEACSATFLGESQASLISLYKSEHSPVRTQLFWIVLENIPLYVSTHLIRHHVGSIPFQLTCRPDRKGGNPDVPSRLSDIKAQVIRLSESKDEQQSQGIVDSIVSELDWLGNNSDRETPVSLSLCINAQALIDIAKLRLCKCASKGTIQVFKAIKDKISFVDPDLAAMMVVKCVYRNGLCGEQRCCGYNSTPSFKQELNDYLSFFSDKQQGKQ